MGYVLILAEKPSQASAYADAFDHSERKDGYFVVSDKEFSHAVITYGFGHLVALFSPEDYHEEWKKWDLNTLPLLPTEYRFKVSDGEAFYSSYKEAETRQIADWLVGMNLSRLYTLYMQKNGMKGVFSIGRVQTPTLYLIYQRNIEIAAFVSKSFFELYGRFSHKKGIYQGKYAGRFDSEYDLEAFKKKHELNDHAPGKITSVKTEEKKQFAPKLFSLSDLQATANKRFHYSASETVKVVQGLYEKKLVSYPRTDTNYIGSPEFDY